MKETLVPAQMVVAEAETATEGVTTGLTVIVIPVDVADAGDAHDSVEVMVHVITSPSDNALDVKVGLLLPTLLPFTFHWYEGVPPLLGVAVNVTPVPEQIFVAEGVTATEGVTVGLIVATAGTRVLPHPNPWTFQLNHE